MQPARSRSIRPGRLVALALVVGLSVLIGVRVRETLARRDAMAAEVAESARQPRGEGARLPTTRGEPRQWAPAVPVTGTLVAVQQASLGFKVGGRLARLRVKVGDRVKAGQVLAELDTAEASAQAAAAAAGVRAAELSLDLARDAERRIEALFASSAVPEAERVAAAKRSALSLAQLEQAKAQRALAATMVSSGTLRAPFGGLITRAPNGIGKIVGPGEPLFDLEDTSVLELTASVSEADAPLVAVGASVELEGGRGKGKVTAVLGSLDPQTRRVPVHAELPNDGTGRLLSGAFVRATVRAGGSVAVLALPASALRPGSQDEVVIAQGGRARIARVAFVGSDDGKLLVRQGLAPADEVVVTPTGEMREGDPLPAADPGAAPAAEPSAAERGAP